MEVFDAPLEPQNENKSKIEFENTTLVADVFRQPEVQKIPAKPGRKKHLRHSNFAIVINTNRRFPDREDPEALIAVAEAKTVMDKHWNLDETMSTVLNFLIEGHEYGTDTVSNIKSKSVVEIGKTNHCLHVHIDLHISHWSRVQLNPPALKKWFKDRLGQKTWVGYKQYYDNKQAAFDYLMKDVNGNGPTISNELLEAVSDLLGNANKSDRKQG